MGTRTAFFALLHAAGREHGWTHIAEQKKKVGGKTIRPDGTFKDEMYLVRGYWEAKDTADKLNVEIEKKRKAGPQQTQSPIRAISGASGERGHGPGLGRQCTRASGRRR